MGIFDGVLLVSDFDGTVYGSRTGMPQRNIDAANTFIAEGGIFAIATGRTYVTFAPHWQCIPTNAPTILSNGASTYDFHQNTLIKIQHLPQTALEDLAKLSKDMPELALEIYHKQDIYAHHPNHITDQHMDIVGGFYTEKPLHTIETPWLKALIQQEHPVLQEARERLLALRPDTYEAIFSNPRYLEITAKGVTKGTAVQELAKTHQIDPAHIYCMGDNENDLPMLAISALPLAPSSSAKVVLDTQPHLLCACADGVLADAVALLRRRYAP